MSQPPKPVAGQINMKLPDEHEAGVFANFAGIWQDNDGLVLDFAAITSAPQPGTDDQGQPTVEIQAKIVSRVRVPPRQALELMRGLNAQLDAWEKAHGPVAGPPPTT